MWDDTCSPTRHRLSADKTLGPGAPRAGRRRVEGRAPVRQTSSAATSAPSRPATEPGPARAASPTRRPEAWCLCRGSTPTLGSTSTPTGSSWRAATTALNRTPTEGPRAPPTGRAMWGQVRQRRKRTHARPRRNAVRRGYTPQGPAPAAGRGPRAAGAGALADGGGGAGATPKAGRSGGARSGLGRPGRHGGSRGLLSLRAVTPSRTDGR